DPTNANFVYAVQLPLRQNALVRASTDGGVTWKTIVPTANKLTAPLVLDQVNPARLLVGGGFLLQSIDRGATFTSLNSPFTATTGVALSAYQGPFVADPGFTTVADQGADTYDRNTIYITDGTTVDLSKDGGVHWLDRS